MTTEQQNTDGGCLCGAIRFQAAGTPKGAGYCHCLSCRRHTGAPVVAFVVFNAEQVNWSKGRRKRFESSIGKFRSFCADCGTSLTFEDIVEGIELIEFHIGSLDRPKDFPPNEHTHYIERIPWLNLSDNLPKVHGSIE